MSYRRGVSPLLTRRWAGMLLATLGIVAVCLVAARWQWNRYESRVAVNEALDVAAAQGPVPVADLVPVDRPAPAAVEYRRVEAVGSYDAARTIVLRLRPQDGLPGSHVLVPLRTDTGAALLVDRGFFPDSGQGAEPPAAPGGRVTVTARLRLSEGAGNGAVPHDGEVRRVDLPAVADAFPYPLYGAWAQLLSEDPRPADAPALPAAPERGTGPHLPYALQWLAFAVMAVGGFGYLAVAEVRGRRRPRSAARADSAPAGRGSGTRP